MIKAIETRWKGYRFRSRLEARWAVFFDALGLKWEYEPEGFHTAEGPYLPDFRVMTPQGNPMWYEIKPEGAAADARLSAFEDALNESLLGENLSGCSNSRVGLLAGDPVAVLSKPEITLCPRCGFICKPAYGFDVSPCSHPRLRVFETRVGCWPCDTETPCGGDNDWEDGVFGCGTAPHKGWILTFSKEPVLPWLDKAAIKARSARFEHGEVPA